MKTHLPADLPVVNIALIDGVIYHVTVKTGGVLQITGVSAADYDIARDGAEAVAEGIMAITSTYPIMAYPPTEAEWRQAHPEETEASKRAHYATEPTEYWSEL